MGPQPYPAETYGKNDEEFRKFEMRLEAHDKFVERRDQLIDALYKPVPKMRVKIPKRIGKKRKAELLKKQNRDVDQIDKNRFFHSLTGDQFVEGLEFKLGLNEKTTKTYSEIFEDLDKVLVNAPLSIKKIVSEHADKRNEKFTPQ